MKKIVVLTLILVLASGLAFGQLRMDAGITVPIGIGAVLDGSSLQMESSVGEFLATTFLPLIETGLYFQFGPERLRMGLGARAFTVILQTMLWPNAFVEYDFGLIVAEAQLGGGALVLLGMENDLQIGKVFFPDLSVWLKLGFRQALRVGAGIGGLFIPEQRASVPVVVYVGGRITLIPD